MKKVLFVFIVLGMTSCMSLNSPDYKLWESYQIENTSSGEVMISFFEEGLPKTVYAEIKDGTFSSNITYESKSCHELWSGTQMTLKAGQTAEIYHYYRHPNDTLPQTNAHASNLCICGQSDDCLHLFSEHLYFVGDSAAISKDGGTMEPLPLQNKELWETWYDEKNFIYYHFWRIGEQLEHTSPRN